MLAETLDEWAAEKFQLGRVEGMEQGLERGMEQGMEQGMERGLERGMERGRAEGRVEGQVEGERALLLRQAGRRFGADVAQALSKLIGEVDDPDRLAEVGDLVVDCATGRELLDRAGRI